MILEFNGALKYVNKYFHVSDKNIFQVYDESIFFSKKKSLENGIKGGKIQSDIKG